MHLNFFIIIIIIIIYSFVRNEVKLIWDALRDLVLFVQF